MGKCFSTENKWRCGYCMAKNAEEIKVCLICKTPRKWLCGNCNRVNPGSSKACLYCFKEFAHIKPGQQQQQQQAQQQQQKQQQMVKHEISQKDVENMKTDTDQRKVNNENTKPENKQSDDIEKKVNEITKEQPELKKESDSNNIDIELTKTDEENKAEDPKAKLLNNIKERRIAVIGTHPQVTTKFCNWIIGMSIFQRDVNNCQQAQVKLFRKKMKIAKTPDLASVSHPAATMKKCTDMLAPGPHVFLKLVAIDNFTAEDKENFSQLNEWFGEKVFGFVIPVLFSKQQSGVSDGDVESYCNQNEDLNGCMQQCDGRFLAGSIFSAGETKVKYLQNLTDIIDNVIFGNNGLHFEPEVAEDNDWDMVMNSYREIAGVAEPGDVKILVKEEGPVEVDPEKQLDRLKRGLDKLTGQANTKM